MDRSFETSDREPLVARQVTETTTVTDELLAAFDALGYDLADREPPLAEVVDPDALAALSWERADLDLRMRVWDHPVRVTADRVAIFPRR